MELTRRPRAWTTVAALALTWLLTVAFASQALARMLSGGSQTSREAALGVARDDVATGRAITSGLILVVCLLTALMAVGIARRREGSRHAAIGTFLLFGVVSLGSALAGLSADPPAPNAGVGLLNGVACLAVFGLLVNRRTAEDFGRAEFERSRVGARSTPAYRRRGERRPT